jgi:hypothetical protein
MNVEVGSNFIIYIKIYFLLRPGGELIGHSKRVKGFVYILNILYSNSLVGELKCVKLNC